MFVLLSVVGTKPNGAFLPIEFANIAKDWEITTFYSVIFC